MGVCSTAVQPSAALLCKVLPMWYTAWFCLKTTKVLTTHTYNPQRGITISEYKFAANMIDPPTPTPQGGVGGETLDPTLGGRGDPAHLTHIWARIPGPPPHRHPPCPPCGCGVWGVGWVNLVLLQASCMHYTTWLLACSRMLDLPAPRWYRNQPSCVRQAPMEVFLSFP